MSNEFDFEPRFGRIGHRKSARPKPFVRQVLDVAYKSGFKTRRKSWFTGQRIGRGAAWGTLASAGLVNKGLATVCFRVSTVKVDKDGSIVLYSDTQAREEFEEPRLPLKANEWDEVLKK